MSSTNDAWYLHSQGRRFGPLTEDEMRGYFRAGMVKSGDEIGIAGRIGSVPAETAAAMLGMAPPIAATGAPPIPTSIVIMQPQPPASSAGWLFAIGVLVAIIGAMYFAQHEPLQPPTETTLAAPLQSATEPTRSGPAASAPEASVFDVAPTIETYPDEAPSEAPSAAPTPDRVAPSDATVRGSPPEGDEWYERAKSLSQAEDWSGLLSHASSWTVHQPTRDLAWWYLGRANMKLESLGDAELAFNRALAISPRHFDARRLLASVYLRTDRHQAARDAFRDLANERPNDSRLWNNLGIAYQNLGEFDDAVAVFEKALQIDPGYRLAWMNLSRCYSQFGYSDRAKAAAARASQL